VNLLGNHYSPINPRRIAQIFITCDVTAFVVQIIGSLMILIPKGNQNLLNLGLKILIAGLAIQVISIFVYLVFAISVYIKAKHIKGLWHRLMWSNIFCSVLIL
ncbi:hypothetical protein HDU93_006978, partial [Gonapodya sp. JEL0774]